MRKDERRWERIKEDEKGWKKMRKDERRWERMYTCHLYSIVKLAQRKKIVNEEWKAKTAINTETETIKVSRIVQNSRFKTLQMALSGWYNKPSRSGRLKSSLRPFMWYYRKLSVRDFQRKVKSFAAAPSMWYQRAGNCSNLHGRLKSALPPVVLYCMVATGNIRVVYQIPCCHRSCGTKGPQG